ncbi:MAG: hypothetical protein H6621_07300 [Halobacteriovoraceae bacterium]|nr:hypothetical protein [Halobacteriovoraceae bacterium]
MNSFNFPLEYGVEREFRIYESDLSEEIEHFSAVIELISEEKIRELEEGTHDMIYHEFENLKRENEVIVEEDNVLPFSRESKEKQIEEVSSTEFLYMNKEMYKKSLKQLNGLGVVERFDFTQKNKPKKNKIKASNLIDKKVG